MIPQNVFFFKFLRRPDEEVHNIETSLKLLDKEYGLPILIRFVFLTMPLTVKMRKEG